MNREDFPYINYYGRMRRTAHRSIAPEQEELNPDPVYPFPEPIPVPEPHYPAFEYNFNPVYPPNYPLAPEHDPEPEYHPGPEYPDHLDDPIYEEPLNMVYPLIPASPDSSHHSSVGDNFDYPEIQTLDSVPNTNPEYLRYILDSNTNLVRTLHRELIQAERTTASEKDMYLQYLTRAKESFLIDTQSRYPASHDDWMRSTLYHFPRTPFWITKINQVLDEGHFEDLCESLFDLKRLVFWTMF